MIRGGDASEAAPPSQTIEGGGSIPPPSPIWLRSFASRDIIDKYWWQSLTQVKMLVMQGRASHNKISYFI